MQSKQNPPTIRRGDLYWVQIDGEDGHNPGIPHPHVVVQEDVFNQSRISTVIVCGITTNLQRINHPGTILLTAGEGNLPKQSLVVVSQISSIEKSSLGEYIGTLSQERVDQIITQLKFLQTSFF